MDHRRSIDLATALATSSSRRSVLKGAAGASVGSLLAALVAAGGPEPASAGLVDDWWASMADADADADVVKVADYGTSTAAVQAALDAAAGGTLIFAPDAHYTLAAPLVVPSNTHIRGNRSTLRYPDDATFDSLLTIADRQNVVVMGLTFDGNVAGQTTWSQYRHAIRILDSADVAIRHNRFVNLIGDGVYVSRGANASPPFAGSSRVWIHYNRFLGSNANRNGVSLICGRQIRIHNNSFHRMGRADMPGAIDLEPNDADEFLQDVRIFANTIDAGGGPVNARFGVCYFDVSGATVEDVSIVDNTIVGPNLGYGVILSATAPGGTGYIVQGNDIRNLTGVRRAAGIYVEGGLAVSVTDNTITDVTGFGIQNVASCLVLRDNAISGATLEDVRHEDPIC